MKRICIIGTVFVFVALTVSLSVKLGLEAVAAEEDVNQMRNLVWEYHEQGNNQSAIQAAEEYLKLIPQDEVIWIILAENYMGVNKLTEAEKAAEESLKLEAKNTHAIRILAAIYRAKAEQDPQLKEKYLSQAESKIIEALKIARDDMYVSMEAVHVYLAQGKRDKAEESGVER